MWIQCFTCKQCQESVERRCDDPLTFFDYCLRCENRLSTEASSAVAAGAQQEAVHPSSRLNSPHPPVIDLKPVPEGAPHVAVNTRQTELLAVVEARTDPNVQEACLPRPDLDGKVPGRTP